MKKSIKITFGVLLALFSVFTTLVSAAIRTEVDREGPSYRGNVIMAENQDFSIASDDALNSCEPVGIPKEAAGSNRTGGSEALDAGIQRCRTIQKLQEHPSIPALSDQKIRNGVLEYAVGDTRPFYSDEGSVSNLIIEVAAVGESCTIWRDQAHPEKLSDETARYYAQVIDTQVHDKMEETFGSWYWADVDGDGKTAFVFYDIPYAGYFSPADLFTKEEYEYASGNVMDVLHMMYGGPEEQEVILSTLVHELQHLINYANTSGTCEIWINEMMSQSAIAVTGLANSQTVYEVKRLTDFINQMGYSAPFVFKGQYVPDAEPVSTAAYGSWYLFGRYLVHQTQGLPGGGNEIFKTILDHGTEQACDLKSVEEALRAVGYLGEGKTVSSIESVVSNFNTAMFVRDSEGIYSLGGDVQDPHNVDGVIVKKIFPLSAALNQIPGGGAATWSQSGTRITEPFDFGAHLRFAGISTEILDGAYIENDQRVFEMGDTITLKTSDQNAPIYYTIDGSDPVANGTLYEKPLELYKGMILKACTLKPGGNYSRISEWKIQVKVGDVTADRPSGKVNSGDQVRLLSPDESAEIYYTIDGSEPSENNGNLYEGPITINQTVTIKALALYANQSDILPGTVKTFVYELGTLEDRYEKNDTPETATALSFPGSIEATIHNADDVDYYRITLENATNLHLTLTTPLGCSDALTLFNASGEVIETAKKSETRSIKKYLKSGIYLIKIESDNGSSSELNPYQLLLTEIMDNEAIKSLDLSEMNMLTALTDSDKSNGGYSWDLGVNGGGNFLMSSAYYTNWQGPVDETDDPFKVYGPFNYKNLSSKAGIHVQNVLFLPNKDKKTFVEHLKNAVYSYGAADIYILSAWNYFTPDYKNLYIDPSYQYPTTNDGGHIVTIVGWDDQYNKDHFTGNPENAGTTLPKPSADGAFIVKNSWGEEAGDGGYFYLSYEDAFMMTNNPAIFIADEMPDNYNHQYMNDPYGCVDFYQNSGILKASETFVNDRKSSELLKAVSFVTGSEDTRFEIYVTIGEETKCLASGVKKYAGYYTENLEKTLTVSPGESFKITLRLESMTDLPVSIGVSKNVNGEVSGVEPVENVAFIETMGGFEDVGSQGIFPNIRAFTCDVTDSQYGTTVIQNREEVLKDTKTPSNPSESDFVRISGQEKADRFGGVAVDLLTSGDTVIPERGLPLRYDLREEGMITPVRNQFDSNACWTFAATACVESSIINRGGFAIDHPEGIALDQSEATLLITKENPEPQLMMTASLIGSEHPASARIMWDVSGDVDSIRLDTSVSMNGEQVPVLTALKPGIVTLTATSDADLSVKAHCVITITEQGVEQIILTPNQLKMKVGEKNRITAIIKPDDAVNPTVVWSSDHPEIVNVNDKGEVTALSGGKAVITAKSGTATATVEIAVIGKPAVNPGSDQPKTGLTQEYRSILMIGGFVITAISLLVVKKKKELKSKQF